MTSDHEHEYDTKRPNVAFASAVAFPLRILANTFCLRRENQEVGNVDKKVRLTWAHIVRAPTAEFTTGFVFSSQTEVGEIQG
jgi:hypothetical protein